MVKVCKTIEDLNEALESAGDKLVVVDFYATWCGPCKAIAPKLESWSKEFTNVVFLKVDVDENTEAAEQHSIEAMPTFKLLKKSKVIEEVVGANADALLAKIKEHM